MSLTTFCCCCDLRRGCIVFAWLQMMGITMTIASLIGYSDLMTYLVTVSAMANGTNKSTDFSGFYIASGVSAYLIKISVAGLFIKAVTCISLTWGIIKKCHLFYQPWLFISGIEVCFSSLGVFVLFILGCAVSPIFFLIFFLDGGVTALNWYFWACVYTVYKRDLKPSTISFELYESTMEPTLL